MGTTGTIKIKLPLFLFALALAILCACTLFMAVGIINAKQEGYGYAIEAYRLSEKPNKFIVLNEPDVYVQEAISQPGKLVFVNQENTEIDELIATHSTKNFEINSKYYEIQPLSVDPAIFSYGAPLIMGWTIFCVLIVVLRKRIFTDKSAKILVSNSCLSVVSCAI